MRPVGGLGGVEQTKERWGRGGQAGFSWPSLEQAGRGRLSRFGETDDKNTKLIDTGDYRDEEEDDDDEEEEC